jgi:heme-degrading monooxygenase HmoA
MVVSNRVQIPDERVETFVKRLQTSHGIEDQPGFQGMKLLSPVDADGYVTMTFWESIEAYEAWRDSRAFDRAHDDSAAETVFDAPNEVEIHEVIVERSPADSDVSPGE